MLPAPTIRLLKYLICVLFFTQGLLHAQQSKLSVREADDLFTNQNYAGALPVFLEELKKDPDNAQLNYKAGLCYLKSRSLKASSVPFLEKAVLNSTSYLTKSYANDKDAPLNAYRYLGDAYYLTYNFPAAIKTYQKYEELLKENKNPDLAEIASTEAKLGMCRLVKNLKPQMTLPIAVAGGKPCNSELATGDYSMTLSPDKTTMIYTVKVPVDRILPDDGSAQYFERMPTNISDTTQTKKVTAGNTKAAKKYLELDTVLYASTVGMSYDGQVVLTYKNDDNEGNLYIIKLEDNKWTAPVKVVKVANSRGWEPHEAVSADGSSLYFVSNRVGGYGGNDLYKCTKLPDGEWSKAVNLGPTINTGADEVAPFIHPDNGTLYFSSNRVKQASFDIFASSVAGNDWTKPVNVGYAINRHDHDIFQVTADKKRMYPAGKPASAKLQEQNSKKTDSLIGPDNEHVVISFVNQQKVPLNILKGKVVESEIENPLGVKITVTDNNNGSVIGQYHSDNVSGLFSIVLPFDKNLNVTYEAPNHLFWSENVLVNKENNYYEKQRSIKMPLIGGDATCTLTNVFFEGNAENPGTSSEHEIEKVYSLLDSLPGIQIKLVNHIYTTSDKKFNQKLSSKRAQAVKDMLLKKGISSDRIETAGKSHTLKESKKEKKEKSGKGEKKKTSAHEIQQPTQVLELVITKVMKQNKQENQ